MFTWITILLVINIAALGLFAVLWRRTRDPEGSGFLKTETVPIPQYQETLPEIEAEISRARRFHHRLSIVVFRLSREDFDHSSTEEARQLQELRFLFLGSLLRDQLRAYDIVTYDPARDQYVVLLVESSRRQALGLVNRMARLIEERAGLTLIAGVAEFPYSGLIIEDLVSRAGDDCRITSSNEKEEEKFRANLKVV